MSGLAMASIEHAAADGDVAVDAPGGRAEVMRYDHRDTGLRRARG
ncbi:MAG: hypothetical protein ACYC2Z_01855 [Candidatus Nanopelagicales bacterium]